MTLKLLGGIILLISGYLSGCYFSGRLTRRKRFFESFLSFIVSLEIRLRYSQLDIIPLISRCAEQSSLPAFSGIIASDEPLSEIWNRRVDKIPSSEGLKADDRELLSQFGTQLGRTDLEGQLKHLAEYRALIEERLNSAGEICQKKSKLYRSLGFFAGAAVTLVLL